MGMKRVALPDIGLDDNVLQAVLIRELDKADTVVPVQNLKNTLTVSIDVQGEGITMKVKRKAKLTVDLKLSVGLLKLRNVLWLIYENDMNEVLLNRPLMKALGFDSIHHLESVSDDYHSMECFEVGPIDRDGGKSSMVMLKIDRSQTTKTRRVAYS